MSQPPLVKTHIITIPIIAIVNPAASVIFRSTSLCLTHDALYHRPIPLRKKGQWTPPHPTDGGLIDVEVSHKLNTLIAKRISFKTVLPLHLRGADPCGPIFLNQVAEHRFRCTIGISVRAVHEFDLIIAR